MIDSFVERMERRIDERISRRLLRRGAPARVLSSLLSSRSGPGIPLTAIAASNSGLAQSLSFGSGSCSLTRSTIANAAGAQGRRPLATPRLILRDLEIRRLVVEP